ncbi:MAG TPA: carbohydrate porin [Hyphomicrobiales bacterium]|nr:carbohydrate porin [Hyphomicrobiales bacterium]
MIGAKGLGFGAALLLLAAPLGGAAWAADVPSAAAASAKGPAPEEMDVGCEDSIAPKLGRLGDPTGLRQALAKKGVSLCVTYTGEVMGNVSGGLRRGALYEDKFEFDLDVDLDKLAGWPGASIHVSGLQIDGNGLSGHNLGNLLTVSNIEAPVSSRLFELWFQQTFFNDKFELRVGQLAADSTFAVSDYAGLFMNATFGFPALLGADLPNGGPAYPFATPGVQATIKPFENFSLTAAIFNGDAIGPKGNCCGVNFRTQDPPLYMAEAKYSYKLGSGDAALPGAVHLGGWYHAGNFGDMRFDNTGLSLANPASTGIPARHQGDGGVYAMIDQMIYKVPGTDDHGLGAFLRIAGAPENTNFIDFYVDGGFTYKGLILGRGDDTIGLAMAFANVSGAISGLDRDTRVFTGVNVPIHDYEAAVELTYQFQVMPGWSIQPDFQYIFHPGGHTAGRIATRPIQDAAVFGLRTVIKY